MFTLYLSQLHTISVSGRQGNRWSTITFRMGKSIVQSYMNDQLLFISPLSSLGCLYTEPVSIWSTQIIQLLGVWTLKDCNLEDPGKIQERLKLCCEEYDQIVAMQQQLGNKQVPISKGVLIFDEVKVGFYVQWNSRMDEFIGHSMASKKCWLFTMCTSHLTEKTCKTS